MGINEADRTNESEPQEASNKENNNNNIPNKNNGSNTKNNQSNNNKNKINNNYTTQQTYNWKGKNEDLKAIIGLKSERYEHKVLFSIFNDHLKNYITQHYKFDTNY